MANTLRDGYSNFKFFQILAPEDIGDTAVESIAVDLQGFDTATIIVNVGAPTGGGANAATDFHQLMLEHFNSVASVWSEVYPSQMIHSVVGLAGAFSTLDSGIFASIASQLDNLSQTHAVGYKGPHRTIRLRISQESSPSLVSMAAIAILGLPGDWPVNTPVGD